MRISSSMYYKNIYGQNNSLLSNNLFDVNKQISSGLKIQYAKDDVRTFSDTMRLDNEIVVLGQIKKSSESGYKISNQADIVLNEFGTTMDRTKTLLIQAANGTNSELSLDAIAKELRALEEHFKNLANSSINGKFLFSGSAVDIKPISDDGTYMGNNISLSSFTGSKTSQQYNISGEELFLGEKHLVRREVTTNVVQNNLSIKYPDFTDLTVEGVDTILTSSDTIRDLMGDMDNDVDSVNIKHHFYIRGATSDGTSFNQKTSLRDDDTIDSLLDQIGSFYGNTSSLEVVNVSLNDYGEIVVEDKIKGSSKIDFHIIGATDFDQTDGNDAANIDDAIYNNITDKRGLINNLNSGETDFDRIINETSEAANSNLYVKNFIQSPYTPATTPLVQFKSEEYAMDLPAAPGDILSITVDNGDFLPATTTYNQAFNIDPATTYDDLKNQIELAGDFTVDIVGDTITLNATAQGVAKGVSVSAPLTTTNGAVTVTTTTTNSVIAANIDATVYDRTEFSVDGPRLSSSAPQIIAGTNAFATESTKLSEVADLSQGTAGTLDGTSFNLEGINIDGNPYIVQIDLATAGSTFTVGPNTYNIYDVGSPRVAVDADEMTYKQLMDVVNMTVTGTFPATAPGSEIDYDNAIIAADLKGSTSLGYDGRIQFKEANAGNTEARIALYDSNSGDFSAPASVMTFNTNNAITVRDPKTDFFKTIDEVIAAVENYKLYPDSSSGDMRNVGIENAIAVIDDLQDHIFRAHAQVGSQSNALSRSIERTELLEISSMTLRSSVIDTDLAEASLTLTQLSLNYEAMLSTVGRISKLSLVNYL